MAYYFIDYENVHDDGLLGVKDLSAEDKVIVFYGTKIKSISFDTHIAMMSSRAAAEYIETHKTAKNYLDFQLITYLGYLIGKGEPGPMIIVSKDLGFDSTVDFWKGRNVKIARRESIREAGNQKMTEKPAEKAPEKELPSQNAQKKQEKAEQKAVKPAEPANQTAQKGTQKKPELPEAFRKKVRTALRSDKLSSGNYTKIYHALTESTDKLALNNTLVKAYGSEKGGEVYGRIKEIFAEYQNSKNQ